MSVYVYETAIEYNFPNITISKILKDGELNGWKITPNEDYVLYNPNANDTEPHPITDEKIPVTRYYLSIITPIDYDFDNFVWMAKLRNEVDEKYIV